MLTYLTGIMSEDKKSIVYDFSKPEFAENLYKVLRSTPGKFFFLSSQLFKTKEKKMELKMCIRIYYELNP